MADLRTYWHTVRHLKPVQIYGRIWFRAVTPRADLRPAPTLRARNANRWVKPIERKTSLVGPTHFHFLGETHDLNTYGWDDTRLERLWRYNLHYFDDLNAENADQRVEWHQALLLRWLEENPPAIGTGWEPYPTSLRIVNWIKWALQGNTMPPPILQSLAVQVRWLSRRLETHLLGNHLFTNAKALVFAGLFYDGSEATQWIRTGLEILQREVPAQILPDGGQFELSPMYHALALEDMLDLANVTQVFAQAVPASWQSTTNGWRDCIQRMRDWLATMCHPDGDISFFNDAASGIAPSRAALEEYAVRLGLPPKSEVAHDMVHLRESGYVRLQNNEAVAIIDVGEIGPSYLPAHAHADSLSFELSLFGRRVFVNSGTSRYGTGAERQRQRATAAHNTVEINGHDSSEVWGGFRVARRAHPQNVVVKREDGVVVEGSHNGYRWLRGNPMHHRTWLFRTNTLQITDEITGPFVQARALYHLHPAIELQAIDVTAHQVTVVRLRLGGQAVRVRIEGGDVQYELSTWHPRFGIDTPNHCLSVAFCTSRLQTQISWERDS